jgi:cysteinyl-tRNA synthetase
MQEGDYFKKAVQNLSHDLANDLASGVFLAHLDEIIDRVDQAGPGIHPKQAKPFGKLLDFIEQAVGLDLLSTSDITKSQKDLISRREAARRASDWHLADSLRAELDEQGIEINDTATGPVWSRK